LCCLDDAMHLGRSTERVGVSHALTKIPFTRTILERSKNPPFLCS
jgi:hypothetical protein